MVHDFLGFFGVILSSGDGAQRRAADPEQVGKGSYHGDYRKTESKSGQGKSALAGNFSYVDTIDDVVYRLYQLRCQHRDRYGEDIAGYVFISKINLL